MCDLKNDLVRRGDVMDELVKEYNRRWQEGGLKLAWIEKAVDSARPVAQPEIIRCKECLWRIGHDCARFTDLPVYMDDYCGRAKRRGENDEPMD